jgi:hypothetical protein
MYEHFKQILKVRMTAQPWYMLLETLLLKTLQHRVTAAQKAYMHARTHIHTQTPTIL